jgi:hypothetical protein
VFANRYDFFAIHRSQLPGTHGIIHIRNVGEGLLKKNKESKMKKNTTFGMALAVLLSASSPVVAALSFDNNGGDGRWATGQNWSGNGGARIAPTLADDVTLGLGNATISIVGGDTALAKNVFGPGNTNPNLVTLDISGGSLQVANHLNVTQQAGSNGLLVMSGGSVTVGDATSDTLKIGFRGTGTLDMTGGTLTSIGSMYVGHNTGGGVGTVNLSGGVIELNHNAASPLLVQNGGVINMSDDGILKFLGGDRTGLVANFVSDGRISVAEGKEISAVFNGTDTVVTVIPEPATLGLVSAFAAGTLFVRRRFMI